MSKSITKNKKIIAWSLVVVIVLLAIVVILLRHENTTRKLLESHLTELHAPEGCEEISSKHYRTDILVLPSRWTVVYKCDTTGKQAYDSIIENLNQNGYQESADYSKQGYSSDCCTYSFFYSKGRVSVHYFFDRFFQAKPLDEIQRSVVDIIELDVYRK